jgi:hypothetical protein
MRTLFRHFLLALLSCALPLGSLAQLDRGAITGTVTDASGAVITKAEIRAKNVATGVISTTLSNEAGMYQISNLPAGTYSVSVHASGFRAYEQSGLQLTVAQRARLDISLKVGAAVESVVVNAGGEQLNTSDPMLATTLQSSEISDMPLTFGTEGRVVETFAFAVTPGVEGNAWTAYMGGGQDFSRDVLVDGASTTAQIQGEMMEQSPTMEAVQEFKVQTSGISAEYGRSSGGFFNFALKSGTNKFHGSAFYYGRNEALDANSWLSNYDLSKNYGGSIKTCETVNFPNLCPDKLQADRSHVFGGSAGGPVVIPGLYNGKNRTFVFGAFEQFEQQVLNFGDLTESVPTADFLKGNFGALLTGQQVQECGATNDQPCFDALGRPVMQGQIYDPATLRQVGGQWVSDPFLGNIIPPDRISAVAGKIINLYSTDAQPMASGLINNYRAQLNQQPWFHESQLTLKSDHNFTSGNRLSGSFIMSQRPRIWGGGIWNPKFGPAGGPLATGGKQEVRSKRISISDNWTFRNNLINTLTLTYNRYRNPGISTSKQYASNGNWPDTLGITGTNEKGFPAISFGDQVNGISENAIGGDGGEGYYVAESYILSDGINWVRGKHNFKFGGEFWQMRNTGHPNFLQSLTFGFSNITTGIPQQVYTNQIGFGFASFFLGEVDSSSRAVPFASHVRRDYVAGYAQDDYKVSRNLTLNLGLRWEQTEPMTEKDNIWSNFNPTIMNTALGVKGALEFASPQKRSFEGPRNWTAFSPRIGAAYALGTKSVVRGSYGIFYSPIGLAYWYGIPYEQFGAAGLVGTDQFPSTQSVPAFNWDGGYPGNYVAPIKDPNFLQWGMVSIDPHALTPGYTQQYNVSFQRSLTTKDIVQVAFMGNDGRRLHDGSLKRNQPHANDWQNLADPWAWVSDPSSAAAAGVPYPYAGFEGFAGFALMPFPQVGATYGPLYYVESPIGSSSYRSFQISYSRNMNHGLSIEASYNFSKAKGNTESAWQETWEDLQYQGLSCDFRCVPPVQDMYNLSEAANTVTSFDQTHVFKGMIIYDLPFGRGRMWSFSNRFLNEILGGWSVSEIFRYSTGFPLTVVPSPSYSGAGWEGFVYADVTPGADIRRTWGSSSSLSSSYFNPGDFSSPLGTSLGNGKRFYDNLRGFGNSNEDFGIMKSFSLAERAKLQIRAELLNGFNRHHFQDPDINVASPSFGQVTTTTGQARIIQFGARLGW